MQMAPLTEILSLSFLISLLSIFLILYLLTPRMRCSNDPLNAFPWVGCRAELFSKTRASIRELRLGHQYLSDGYAKVRLSFPPHITRPC